MKFFGSSGIRGVANLEISPLIAQRLGAALATIHEGGEIIVGKDTRITGTMLETALSSGINSCGADAKLVGVLPTPVIAWLTHELGSDAGVAISASHNPPQYNGFKVFNKRGMSLTEKEQGMIEKLIEDGEFDHAPWDGVGTTEEADITWMYIDRLQDEVKLSKNWKIACDLFCGATSSIATYAFEAVGIRASLINGNPDGHFSAGNPEPTEENLRRIGDFTKSIDADVGFCFDGDGDRVMVVDGKGRPISGDKLLAAYAGYLVGKAGKGLVVTHVGTSMCIEDMVERAGGKVVRVKVGDSYISQEIEKRNAIFGGEPIGAWILPELNMCPDGILCALKLLEALEDVEQSLSEFVSNVPDYSTMSAKFEVNDKLKTMKGIEKNYRTFFDTKDVNRLDGLRLQLAEGWVLIRPSGTEPIIRITTEGKVESSTKSLIERGKQLIKEAMA